MRLSKREIIMLVLLMIVALVFVEYRFVITPGIEKYEPAPNAMRFEAEVRTIEMNMAIAKQNETKRDEPGQY